MLNAREFKAEQKKEVISLYMDTPNQFSDSIPAQKPYKWGPKKQKKGQNKKYKINQC